MPVQVSFHEDGRISGLTAPSLKAGRDIYDWATKRESLIRKLVETDTALEKGKTCIASLERKCKSQERSLLRMRSEQERIGKNAKAIAKKMFDADIARLREGEQKKFEASVSEEKKRLSTAIARSAHLPQLIGEWEAFSKRFTKSGCCASPVDALHAVEQMEIRIEEQEITIDRLQEESLQTAMR